MTWFQLKVALVEILRLELRLKHLVLTASQISVETSPKYEVSGKTADS